ncbi:GUN4 domain-containing protein [Spirulina sp. 06S082]|uniref:GUN4 domain-containing protein n=1 Tax=Spirulina sp. 06S082 TaxID=3110248 RepID=UPI002B209FA6|nr:GUN4 domain-containing protein [Spirulina sp. 06S082]MEA5468519.1 GUN4 domain-containing protein [Spirulina sp. 06S082]
MNGHFGFSVQKRIYESLGEAEKYDYEIWKKFGTLVGWRVKGTWLYYKDFTFNASAPQGHLPGVSCGGGKGKWELWGVGTFIATWVRDYDDDGEWWRSVVGTAIFYRLKDCGM